MTKLSGIAVVGCAAVVALVGGALPAQAEDLRYVAPSRITVNQAYENVAWRVAGPDIGLVDYVDANLEHAATREASGFDFDSTAPFGGTFKFYDFERMGRYRVYGEITDADFNQLTAASTYVVIKRASRTRLTAQRSGRYVLLRGVTRRYSGGYPLWPTYRGTYVRYQRLAAGTWKTIAIRKVPASGVTQVRTRRATAADYRVRVFDAPTVWGSFSGTVRR